MWFLRKKRNKRQIADLEDQLAKTDRVVKAIQKDTFKKLDNASKATRRAQSVAERIYIATGAGRK